MRYRKQTADGDYVFGRGPAEIMKDTPEAVGQAVKTRLLLNRGEWFLDTSAGTPYIPDILGHHATPIFDQVIQDVILKTQGVRRILEYVSDWNTTTRHLSVVAKIDTIYGTLNFNEVLQ